MIKKSCDSFLAYGHIPCGCGEALNDISLRTLNFFMRQSRCVKNYTTAPAIQTNDYSMEIKFLLFS